MRNLTLDLSLLALLALACAKVDHVAVPATPLVFTAAGQHEAIRAKAVDGDGQPMPKEPLRFSSSNAEVATVDANGVVTSAKSGTADIEVAAGEKKATVPVDVRIPAKLEVAPLALVGVGTPAELKAKVLDEAGRPVEGATVAFAAADPAIATVNGHTLTTAGIGQTKVVATFGALRAEAPVAVTLPTFDHIDLQPAAVKVNVGTAAFLQTAVKDASGAGVAGVNVTFASSDATIASVDAGGKIMGIAPGTATVTATAGEKSAAVSVTVSK